MSTPNPLIVQYTGYLRLQKQIAKAIDNRDEPLLNAMKGVSQELFLQLEGARQVLVETTNSGFPQEPISRSNLATLIQLMEQVQRQVQENEIALQAWLNQMNADLQHYRTSQSPHGVLSTYIQQKLAGPVETTEGENLAFSPESLTRLASSTIPSSPWALPAKESDTVGHQVNHES